MKIAGYEVSQDEYKALDHVLQGGENPEQWITRVAARPTGVTSIPNKIAVCVERYNDTPVEQRTTRVQREAEELAMEPTAEEIATGQEMVLTDLYGKLSTAKQKGLRRAEKKFEEQIAQLEAVLEG